LHISKMNILQRAIIRCLNCFISDTLHSADPSVVCWWKMSEFALFPLCSLRNCEHIIKIYVEKYKCIGECILFRKDVVTFKMMGKGKGGIIIFFLFTYLMCNNKRNVIIIYHCV
jgi:hypothetical protein